MSANANANATPSPFSHPPPPHFSKSCFAMYGICGDCKRKINLFIDIDIFVMLILFLVH